VPTMSRRQLAFCRSAPWRAVARRVVLPWALQGVRPEGAMLEIGAGSGAMAAELASTYPEVRLTVTDIDEAMVQTASTLLRPFGGWVRVCGADAPSLPFPDGSFDAVLSWVMLHHTVQWEQVLAEALRVLRPGGRLVGYDLLSSAPLRLVHRTDGASVRLVHLPELREELRRLPTDHTVLSPSLGGFVVRFNLQKSMGR
jgi:ubiquinone/menaquinone biosynthesis C-methylase UbiE